MANQVTTVSFVLVPANAGSSNRIMEAVDGDMGKVLAEAQRPTPEHYGFLGRLFGEEAPDITAEAVVDNGATPVATEIVDLTDKGVTFPSGTMRKIRWRWWEQTDNDRYFVEQERWVLGGTTPVLLGTRRVEHAHGVIAGTNTAYGLVPFKAAIASGAATESTTENGANIALGDFTAGAATLTAPANRSITCLGVNFAAATYGATTGAVPHVETASGSTAGSFELGAADDGLLDTNPADGVLEALFHITPPGDCQLVMNSNAVEMQITGIANDETRHRVEIFIGRAVQVAFQGS